VITKSERGAKEYGSPRKLMNDAMVIFMYTRNRSTVRRVGYLGLVACQRVDDTHKDIHHNPARSSRLYKSAIAGNDNTRLDATR
jgi:hypothetical protein